MAAVVGLTCDNFGWHHIHNGLAELDLQPEVLITKMASGAVSVDSMTTADFDQAQPLCSSLSLTPWSA